MGNRAFVYGHAFVLMPHCKTGAAGVYYVPCFLFNFINSSTIWRIASTSLEHIVETGAVWIVFASCGHVPKHANNTMRGRLWCVSCNAVAARVLCVNVFLLTSMV